MTPVVPGFILAPAGPWATDEVELMKRSRPLLLLPLLLVALCLPDSANAKVVVQRITYHGWSDALLMSNATVSVVIVPAIGRVMQFGFSGEEGVFWENRALDSREVDSQVIAWAAKEWVNFGGDKTWPSPEANWSAFTGRKGWRPPPAFDGIPSEATVSGDSVVLTTTVDPFYGVRAVRRVELHSSRAEMKITTTYERVEGEPANIGIWVITQLKEPEGVFAPVPRKSMFKEGYIPLGQTAPPSLKMTNGFVSLTRNARAAHKIGLDGDSLLWVGPKHALRIDSSRERRGLYPDKGSSTEIYTNPDPLPYVELEMLGPVQLMKKGDKIQRSNRYTLTRRTQPTPEAEARHLFGK